MADIDDVERFAGEQAARINYPRLLVWKNVLFHPDETLAAELKAPSLKRGAKDTFTAFYAYILVFLLAYVLIYGLMFGALFGFVGITSGNFQMCAWPLVGIAVGIVAAVLLAGIFSAFAVAGWLINSAIEFALARLLGGKGSFTANAHLYAVINAAMYVAFIPFIIVMFIPCIGTIFSSLMMLLSIYSIYLKYKAVRMVHGLSQKRALAVVLIPVLFALLVAAAMFVAYFVFIFAAVGMGAGGH